MTISITTGDIQPYATIPEGGEEKAEAWLASINAALTARYGSIPVGLEAAVYDIVGQAITNRFDRESGKAPDPNIKSQAIAGASVEYWGRAVSGYFAPDDITALDSLLGGGSVRSIRTPAPDGIRYGNLMRANYSDDGLPIESVI